MAKDNYDYLFYLYHLPTEQFVTDEQLNKLQATQFDFFTKTAITTEADGNGNESTHYYKYYGKTLLLIKSEYLREDSSKMEVKEFKIENGQSILIKTYFK